MDFNLLLIPVALVCVGVIVMVFLNKRGGNTSSNKAEEAMQTFIQTELPNGLNLGKKCINVLPIELSPKYFWVLAYDYEKLYFIPAVSNPFKQEITRYVQTVHYDLRKRIVNNLFGDAQGNLLAISVSELKTIEVDESKMRLTLYTEEDKIQFKVQNKDIFGADQSDKVTSFFMDMKLLKKND